MKVSHESPLCMLEESRNYNDYDYALVHLFEENKEYYEFFVKSLKMNREVMLDNSIFELGDSFDKDKYLYWINKLQPTYYIIPDVFDDAEKTMNNVDEWMTRYQPKIKCDSKKICVAQGATYYDAVDCYEFIKKYADRIAIPFECKFYTQGVDDDDKAYKLLRRMSGRQQFIYRLDSNGILDHNKEHHLLGCALPQEFRVYKNIDCITSCDTSNPVVHGMLGYKYSSDGLYIKENTKLCDLLNAKIDITQYSNILYNINMFKQFAK
jgi:hypothetical protein